MNELIDKRGMRKLTLDEKITLKGILAHHGVIPRILVKANMKGFLTAWYFVAPGPISKYYKHRRCGR